MNVMSFTVLKPKKKKKPKNTPLRLKSSRVTNIIKLFLKKTIVNDINIGPF